MKYKIIKQMDSFVIEATDENNKVSWIPFDGANSDYQQYLIDTNGGLPIPEENK